MKHVLQRVLLLAVYVLLLYGLYVGIINNGEHEEVGALASLICYSCIGV